MNHDSYRAHVIRLYLDLQHTPAVATDNDWAVAADLERKSVPLEIVAHALRLATLRRNPHGAATPGDHVHSLSYYRRVIANLAPDELEPDYIDYVERRFRLVVTQTPPDKPRTENQNPAVSRSR